MVIWISKYLNKLCMSTRGLVTLDVGSNWPRTKRRTIQLLPTPESPNSTSCIHKLEYQWNWPNRWNRIKSLSAYLDTQILGVSSSSGFRIQSTQPSSIISVYWWVISIIRWFQSDCYSTRKSQKCWWSVPGREELQPIALKMEDESNRDLALLCWVQFWKH